MSSRCIYHKSEMTDSLFRLHAVDVVVVHVLLKVLQIVPPLEEESVCNEAEPGRDLHFFALGLL